MIKKLLPFLVIAITLLYTGRLFFLQVIDRSYDESPESNSAVKVVYDYPNRGFIFDRNNKLVVANQLSYDVMVIPREVKLKDTLEFCRHLSITKENFIDRINKAKNYSPHTESIFFSQLSKKEYASLQEKMFRYRGFYIQKRSLREYPSEVGANVLGYISEVNESLIKENPYYQKGELIGSAGVEKTYENQLRGTKGKKYIKRDRFNNEIGSYKDGIYDTIPILGKDITLTIDIDLQKYGEALMKNKRGGIVAIEPSTGEILALVTSPSYNPSLLIGRQRSKNFLKLYNDSINRPLFDRGLKATYPPGSPFKAVNALIALQEGVVNTSTTMRCYGGYQYASGKNYFMACHCGTNGAPVALGKAIYRSCNSYFSDTYRKIINKYPSAEEGTKIWSDHVKSFGLGNYLNNDLSVGEKGLVPDDNYYNRMYRKGSWRSTTTISNAIGQGELLVTPIQLANMTAAIANRGYYYTPHIVKKIMSDTISSRFKTLHNTTIDKKHFTNVIEGMYNVVNHPRGTAKGIGVEGLEMCGKTGTAQNPHGQDHSVFIAFAPKENPKIVIATYVENGYWGSRWAGPISSLMIEKYINGEVKEKLLEKRMLEGSLQNEYNNQLLKSLEK